LINGKLELISKEIKYLINPIHKSKLDLYIKDIFSGKLSGEFKSLLSGYSSDFLEYKEYNYGDSINLIDWKVFARKEKLYIKKFQHYSDSNIYFVLDSSESMSYREKFSKFEYGFLLVSILSLIFSFYRNRVFLITYINNRYVQLKIDSIKELYKTIDILSKTHYSASFFSNIIENKNFFLSISSNSIVFLLSDFMEDEKIILEFYKLLEHKTKRFYGIQIITNDELNLNFDENINLVDIENKEESYFLESKSLKRKYIEEVNRWMNNLKKIFTKRYNRLFIYNMEEPSIFAIKLIKEIN